MDVDLRNVPGLRDLQPELIVRFPAICLSIVLLAVALRSGSVSRIVGCLLVAAVFVCDAAATCCGLLTVELIWTMAVHWRQMHRLALPVKPLSRHNYGRLQHETIITLYCTVSSQPLPLSTLSVLRCDIWAALLSFLLAVQPTVLLKRDVAGLVVDTVLLAAATATAFLGSTRRRQHGWMPMDVGQLVRVAVTQAMWWVYRTLSRHSVYALGYTSCQFGVLVLLTTVVAPLVVRIPA